MRDLTRLFITETGLTEEEALEVLKTVRGEGGGGGGGVLASLTALELLQKEEELRSIVTFSSQLDESLGGGIPIGKTTEICGVPGIGKTQLWSETHTRSITYRCLGVVRIDDGVRKAIQTSDSL